MEGRKEGGKGGREEGRKDGRKEGKEEGMIEGRREGRKEGREGGREGGRDPPSDTSKMNTSTHYELKHNHFYIFIRICVECYNGGIFSHGQVHHVGLSYIDLLRFASRPFPSCWALS